jgi:single-stranded DNA-binding protein
MKVQHDRFVAQSIKHFNTKQGKAAVRINAAEIMFSKNKNKDFCNGYYNLVFWDNVDQLASLQPGSVVNVLEGDLKASTYDKRDGSKGTSLDITVRNFQVTGAFEPHNVFGNNARPQQGQPQQQAQQPQYQQQTQAGGYAPQQQQPQYQPQQQPQYQAQPQNGQPQYASAPTYGSYGN